MGIFDAVLNGGQISVVICGGGHVGYELEKLCGFMGYDVTVIEKRSELAAKERFPYSMVICGDYAEAIRKCEGGCYYVIVTPDHRHDTECLAEVLKKDHAYAGMIGSRQKVASCMEQLKKMGYSDEILSGVCAPIGVPISSVTPKEIAVSIMGQIIRKKNENPPEFFIDRSDMQKLRSEKGTVVCAAITDKRGSAPRGKGACIFVCESGSVIGTVGGGKWEADVISDMRDILNGRAEPCKRTYTSQGEDALCGGEIDVMFEVKKL